YLGEIKQNDIIYDLGPESLKILFEELKKSLIKNLQYLLTLPADKLLELRYNKYRNIGFYKE
ncbi:MAG: hypothetical protein ACK4NF_01915, partial [Planctomycetota bacterium]